LFFGLLIAIVLYPVCKWLELKKMPKSLAIALSLGIVMILIAGLVFLFAWQWHMFSKDIPMLRDKIAASLPGIHQWIDATFNISISSQENYWQQLISGGNMQVFVQSVIRGVINGAFTLLLVPVFAALFLYNRKTFVASLLTVVGESLKPKLPALLKQVTQSYHKFIRGMVIVYIMVGVLNSIGLLALGIEHAILFGMLTAIMTIIPYVGIILSALLPISIAWITRDSMWYPLGVIAVFTFVQYLEANIIFPSVVGSQLNISTWATLVAILAGGLLWGVAGMILFIPFLGILKLFSNEIESWKPINIILSR
jgi:predicted PurR-regulated permease PerM